MKNIYFKLEEKISKNVTEKMWVFSIFTFITIYLIFWIVVPFFRYNNLISWDMIGHYFSAWYQKEYLFPNMIGWNPFFFTGYPQNQFYPPLFSYLTSLLSIVIPLNIAFKLLTSLSILITPFSFYYFARSFNISKTSSSVVTLAMFSILFIFNNSFGGDFQSTFEIGLVTNTLGLVLFFYYFGSLIRSCEKKKNLLLPTILLSLIVISHIVVTFVSIIALFSIALVKINDKLSFKFFISHTGLAFLLTSFWTLPFIFKINFMDSIKIGLNNNYLSFILIFVIIYTIISIYKNQKEIFPIASFLLILSFFTLIGLSYLTISFHFYRLTLFFLLFVPISLFSLLKKDKYVLFIIIAIIAALFIFNFDTINIKGPDIEKIENLSSEISINSGRTLVLAGLGQEAAPHYLQNKLIIDNKIIGSKGLFVESSKSSKYILNLEKEIDKNSFSWGTYIYSELINESKDKISEILPYQFNILQINYVISPQENSFGDWKKIKFVSNFGTTNYYLYQVGNYTIIDLLDYVPEKIEINSSQDEQLETLKWFLSEDIKQGLKVYENVPNYTSNGKENIEIKYISRRQDEIKIYVNSSNIVPILIKNSYYPNWKAYQNGKEIKIYKASPNIMLIYGKENIEIKYVPIFVDKLGTFLTLLGIMILTITQIKRYKRIYLLK